MDKSNDLVEVTIKIDPEIKENIEALKEESGITDTEIFAIGLFKTLQKSSLEEVLEHITPDKYLDIIKYAEDGLDKLEAYLSSKR